MLSLMCGSNGMAVPLWGAGLMTILTVAGILFAS
jgi:hypothetical protein